MIDFNWDLSQISDTDLEDFERKFSEEKQKRELANKRKHWGKLGGRPAPKGVRNVQKNLRLREDEYLKIEQKSKEVGLSVSEFLRRSALEIPLPDPVRNNELIKVQIHFKRIANYFQKKIWSVEEKREVIDEIKKVSSIIKKNLK